VQSMREEQSHLAGLSLLCFGQRNTGKSGSNTLMLHAVECVKEFRGCPQLMTPIKPSPFWYICTRHLNTTVTLQPLFPVYSSLGIHVIHATVSTQTRQNPKMHKSQILLPPSSCDSISRLCSGNSTIRAFPDAFPNAFSVVLEGPERN